MIELRSPGSRRSLAPRTLSLLAALSCAAIVGAVPVAAEETFVCDDGRVLTLTQDEIRVLVQTDPCIAQHYGSTVAAEPAAEPPPAVPVDLPLPTRKPEEIVAKLRALDEEATSPAGESEPVAIADVPSDYRNVHIINGGSAEAPEYYRHMQ